LLNEKQKSLVALQKEFCEREVDRKALNELADKPIPPNATREQLSTRIPWDLINKAQDVGLRQLCVPKQYGGGGLGFAPGDWVTLAALAEATGYYGGQAGRIFTIPWKHCRSLSTAPKEVQEEFFPAFMKNRKTMVAASITEPDHGSDLLLPYDEPGYSGKVIATQDGDYWVVNGEKMWCTAGGVSDYIILNVRTDKEGPITKSATSFLLPTKTKGWSIARVNDFMGNEMTANVQMHFDNCRIHKRLMISKLNDAWLATRSSLAGKAIHTTARLGETIWMWEHMRDYAKNRVQGGKPIIQHPNVGTQIAEAEVLIQTARLMVYKFMWESDQTPAGQFVNPKGYWYINYWVKFIMQRLTSIGLDIYGGMGPHKDLPFERWIRFNLSLIHGGSTGTLCLLKASHVM
jgi:alkylation response protein AidB-like acyl-CoA dehydrogenase